MSELTLVNKINTVSEIVRRDYRTADIFKKWGINYCCGGNLPLAEACALRKLDVAAVQQELDALICNQFLPAGVVHDEWPVEFLIDYIIYVHHSYLKRVLPPLGAQLHSFVAGHLKKYPYLQEVGEVFAELSAELTEHNQQEEDSIFPYLKQIASTYRRRETYGSLFVRTMGKPLDRTVNVDHKRILALLTQLREVTHDYHFLDTACTNHQVIYHKLKELDNNLVQHKHLENNILFPKVLQMEQELLNLHQ